MLKENFIKFLTDNIGHPVQEAAENLTKSPTKAFGEGFANLIELLFSPIVYANQLVKIICDYKLASWSEKLNGKSVQTQETTYFSSSLPSEAKGMSTQISMPIQHLVDPTLYAAISETPSELKHSETPRSYKCDKLSIDYNKNEVIDAEKSSEEMNAPSVNSLKTSNSTKGDSGSSAEVEP